VFSLIKHALSAVIGVGKKREPNISPGGILIFALLVGIMFLGSITFLMFLASIIVK
tara:strand:+ start:1317 stop:1484 length:168 start_codon:yes stop_codon:yes gene_type:complete